MTVDKAIKDYDQLYPNTLPYEKKLEFISRLDKRIYDDIYSKYENCSPESFDGYSYDCSPLTELLVSAPYDGIYIKYIASQIDLINGDISRYNNSANVFNSEFSDFSNMYNRTHKWKSRTKMGVPE